MQLDPPVTVNLPDATTVQFTELLPIFIDDPGRKFVFARFHPVLRPLMLWKREEYDAVGDWTQAQAEAKILALLGNDVQATLQSLVMS